jgi:hypothetical protein
MPLIEQKIPRPLFPSLFSNGILKGFIKTFRVSEVQFGGVNDAFEKRKVIRLHVFHFELRSYLIFVELTYS